MFYVRRKCPVFDEEIRWLIVLAVEENIILHRASQIALVITITHQTALKTQNMPNNGFLLSFPSHPF